MREQFRVERYERTLMRIRWVSVGMTLYAIGVFFYASFINEKSAFVRSIWKMLAGMAGAAVVFLFLSGIFAGSVGSIMKKRRDVVFLPVGVLMLLGYIGAQSMKLDEVAALELTAFIVFSALNVFALYLANYVRFVRTNQDAEYMALYHVTLGNGRAYRVWYLITALAIVVLAVMPIWGFANNFWNGALRRIGSALRSTGGDTEDVDFDPLLPLDTTATPELVDQVTEPSKFWVYFGTALYILVLAVFAIALVVIIRSLISRTTETKANEDTDRVIDLKRTFVPGIDNETVRVRDDSVIDENQYARRIRRIFKRKVYDRYGNADIPELTPVQLLGADKKPEEEGVLLEKYEKARYSNIPCTSEDVKAVRPQK